MALPILVTLVKDESSCSKSRRYNLIKTSHATTRTVKKEMANGSRLAAYPLFLPRANAFMITSGMELSSDIPEKKGAYTRNPSCIVATSIHHDDNDMMNQHQSPFCEFLPPSCFSRIFCSRKPISTWLYFILHYIQVQFACLTAVDATRHEAPWWRRMRASHSYCRRITIR